MDGMLINAIHWITRAIEITGTAIIVIGAAAALIRFLGTSKNRSSLIG